MKAHYGYQDGSGTYYITIDTDRCDGCRACVEACPRGVLTTVEEDPVEERMVAAVAEALRNQIKYACDACKPRGYAPSSLACLRACKPDAIIHSW